MPTLTPTEWLLILVLGLTAISLAVALVGRNRSGNGTSLRMMHLLIEQQKSELESLHEDMEIWRELALRRGEQLERIGLTPAPRAQIETLASIAKDIEAKFSIEELAGLAFDVGIRPDSLSGDTLPERARQLVLAADRRHRLTMLLEEIKRQRPE